MVYSCKLLKKMIVVMGEKVIVSWVLGFLVSEEEWLFDEMIVVRGIEEIGRLYVFLRFSGFERFIGGLVIYF